MSIPFFNDVLAAIGRRLNYESVSNLYGNSFCKDAGKYIQEAYPLTKLKKIGSGMASIFAQATIVKSKSTNKKDTEKALAKDLGDLSWAEGLLKGDVFMDNMNTDYNEQEELSLKEYYAILVKMCNALEENPDNDFAVAAFTDAAWHLAKADCGHLFPEDLLCVNAAKTPEEGTTITAVKEEDCNVIQ